MNKSFNVTVDIEKDLYSPGFIMFTVSRNDYETVDIFFQIMQDGQPMNLVGTTIELAVKKPSGLVVYQNVDINEAEAGTAQTRLSIQGYLEYGVHTAELYVRNANQLAVSCPFYYHSREAIMETESVESINDLSALQDALFSYDRKPVLTEGFPEGVVPEYVGQRALDIVNKVSFVATDVTADSWIVLGAGEGGGGVTSWDYVTGKPDVFPPDVTDPGLTAALAGKAETVHSHPIDQITGLAAELASKLEAIPPEYLTEAEADAKYITTAAADAKYITAIPDDLLTTAEGDARYISVIPPEYLTEAEGDARYITAADADASYLTPAEGDARYLTSIPAAYLTETEADAKYLTGIPVEYLTETEGDARYELKGAIAPATAPAWGEITGTLSDQADLQSALNLKADDSDLAAKADVTALDGKANTVHTHAIADVTGLQAALDGKVDDVQLEGIPTYDDVYVKAEVYNKTEIDQMTMGTGGGSPVIVEDNLASTSTTNALSANQGRILSTTKASLNHTHTVANITDFASGVAANIPVEYLTTTEADAAYATKAAEAAPAWGEITGTLANQTDLNNALAGKSNTGHTHTVANITDFAAGVSANIPATYLTDTEADAVYSKLGHTHTVANITDFAAGVSANIPAEYLTATEGDAAYAAKNHTHTSANITDFASAVAANIPATYETTSHASATYETITHASATYQVKGSYLTAVPIMTGSQIGGAMVGNGLGQSNNYLYVKAGAGLGINTTDNSVQVQTTNTTPAPVRFWTGTNADYTAITTKDANTLYFITG